MYETNYIIMLVDVTIIGTIIKTTATTILIVTTTTTQ